MRQAVLVVPLGQVSCASVVGLLRQERRRLAALARNRGGALLTYVPYVRDMGGGVPASASCLAASATATGRVGRAAVPADPA